MLNTKPLKDILFFLKTALPAVFLVIIDQISKHLCSLAGNNCEVIINRQASSTYNWALIIVNIAVILLVIVTASSFNKRLHKDKGKLPYLGILFLFAGTMSNTIDRLFYQGVIDPWRIVHFQFNLADSYIFLGVICLLTLLY